MGTENLTAIDPRAKQQRDNKDKKKKDESKRDVSIKGTLQAIKDRQRLLDEV